MSVDERTRHEMYSGLEDKLGTSVADALMAHLPPTGWADVARQDQVSALRTDLDVQGVALRTEIAAQGVAFRRDLDALGVALRGEILALGESVRRDLDAQSDTLRREMSSHVAVLRGEMSALEERVVLRVDAKIQIGINRLLYFLIPTMASTIGLSFAAARFA